MDAYGYILILCLMLQGLSCQPMVEEGDLIRDPVEDESTLAPTTTEISPPEPNCITAKGVPGTCVTRQYCDYSTSAIDLTLYAPRGYVKPCKTEDVCCPFDSIIKAKETSHGDNDTTGFEFDDDD
ncbi:uncharacterized protein LOC126379019 [Pectinophora gossypiella]|uniref:uncharacterized protein LOC126379019 n=1 Tax=Pectinophora gossypiella TaxID=13191 RepID=UPI00214E9235|nr:uncharacterized protein LOC126379019 [Pectinophora gossypiella]